MGRRSPESRLAGGDQLRTFENRLSLEHVFEALDLFVAKKSTRTFEPNGCGWSDYYHWRVGLSPATRHRVHLDRNIDQCSDLLLQPRVAAEALRPRTGQPMGHFFLPLGH